MIRKLLSIFAVGGAAASAQPAAPRSDASKILPYVVPAVYLEYQREDAKLLTWPLGHGLHFVLVHDLGGSVGNVLEDGRSCSVKTHSRRIGKGTSFTTTGY